MFVGGIFWQKHKATFPGRQVFLINGFSQPVFGTEGEAVSVVLYALSRFWQVMHMKMW
jgi:hypothetical protein